MLSIISVSVLGAASPARTDADQLYVVIVANNKSLDEDMTPLRFADDDGAKYFEMFRAAGAHTSLLTVLDPDAQTRFPAAAAAAIPPTRDALMDRVKTLFEEMASAKARGQKTHFVFVYSGHGNVGANREGYLNLIDTRFGRRELFQEILAKSPASYNHIVLDACHAYFMVNKKGENDKTGDYGALVRNFLSAEELGKYPNTGVILASSSESETHEWGRWESGIFSHELRSALLGAGDVNGDGKVTYAEAAACVEAANAGIDIPRARLKVFYQAPAVNVALPLMDLSAFSETTAKVVFPKVMAGKYHVEDARGVRIADFNYSAEQSLSMVLPGSAPFFVRTETEESSIEPSRTEILASNLTFKARASASKGSVERSFRKHLYTVPFGMGFYRGALAMLPEKGAPPPEPVLKDSAAPSRATKTWGWITLGSGLATGIGAAASYALARNSYDQYQNTDNKTDADAFQRDSEKRLLTTRVLLGVGSALTVTGATLLIVDAVRRKKSRSQSAATPLFTASDSHVSVGIQQSF
jgi:hypothetical protein